MTRLLQKEIRLLLPSFIVAELLTFIAASTGPTDADLPLPLFLFFVGAVIVALAPFGQEYSLGTFPALLAQPVTRPRLWAIKTALTAAVLLLTVGLYVTIAHGGPVVALALIALTALASGSWTTIVFRQIGAAFVFAILAPYAIILLSILNPFSGDYPATNQAWLAAAMIVYSVTAIVWSRRAFLRASGSDVWNRRIAWPAWLKSPERAAKKSTRTRQPLRALVMKELASQQMAFLLAGGLLILHLGALAVRKFWSVSSYGTGSSLESVPMLLWLFVPWIVGAMAVAEERKQGTLVSQLCLPVARYRQFSVKLAVALLVGFSLGCVLPLALESLASDWAGIPKPQLPEWRATQDLALQWSVFALGSTLLSFFASSLARHVLEALIVTLILAVVLWIPAVWFLEMDPPGPLITLIVSIALVCALVIRSFANYQAPVVTWRHWVYSAGVLYFTLFFAGNAATAIYYRPWERLMTLDSHHGPARLSGPVSPKLFGPRAFPNTLLPSVSLFFALLPDGRIWGARTFQGTVPTSGEFLEGSSWTDLAYGQRFDSDAGIVVDLAALGSDGSLWQFAARPVAMGAGSGVAIESPHRTGRDNDWKSLATLNNALVAVKNDGSVWWWIDFAPDARRVPDTYRQTVIELLAAEEYARRHGADLMLKDGRIERRRSFNQGIAQLKAGILSVVDLYAFVAAPPSAYSDWLAGTSSAASDVGFVALAADGSLCSWRDTRVFFGEAGDRIQQSPALLAPSSRPRWCFNMLTGAQLRGR